MYLCSWLSISRRGEKSTRTRLSAGCGGSRRGQFPSFWSQRMGSSTSFPIQSRNVILLVEGAHPVAVRTSGTRSPRGDPKTAKKNRAHEGLSLTSRIWRGPSQRRMFEHLVVKSCAHADQGLRSDRLQVAGAREEARGLGSRLKFWVSSGC